MDESIVHYFGEQLGKCGYCKGTSCSKSHGMHAYVMNVVDYQDLIDRGWRRCGLYCYKPNNKITCCPSYAIRCDTGSFTLSKSQKKILKRMNRFLRDGKREPQEIGDAAVTTNAAGKVTLEIDSISDKPEIPDVKMPKLIIAPQTAPIRNASKEGQSTQVAPQAKSFDKTSEETTSHFDISKPPIKKAKQMRLERRQAKLGTKEVMLDNKKSSMHKERTLSDFINDTSPSDKHKLKIVIVASNTVDAFTNVEHKLYCKYQIDIHKDNPQRLTPANMQKFLYKSPLTEKLVQVNSEEFGETLKQTYSLYIKYQTRIHNDPPENVKSYLEFLQESPLQCEKNYQRNSSSPEMGYGSFHQQYWLDDTLIAVGVIDILPMCLSSVYFFYDPDYSFLSLGTYGSLREIEFVQQLALQSPALKYYYMGFYIHSCPKMRYKGKLSASYLLCPETYVWELLTDDVRAKLDENKYQRFCLSAATVDRYAFTASHLNDATLLIYETRERKTYGQHIQQAGDEDLRVSLLEYGTLVGNDCAQRLRYLKILND